MSVAVSRGVEARAVRRRERKAGCVVCQLHSSEDPGLPSDCVLTYHNGPVDPLLNLARRSLLLLTQLLLPNLCRACTAGRR